jgi:hypothetical protein
VLCTYVRRGATAVCIEDDLETLPGWPQRREISRRRWPVDPQDPRLGRRCALAESSGVHKAPALYNSSALHPLSRE